VRRLASERSSGEPEKLGSMSSFGVVCTSERLELRPVPWDDVEAIVNGERRSDWAEDFPDEGDVVVADLLHDVGPHQRGASDLIWSHRQVVERSSGLVVGGIGFSGPPENGVAEIGYGIVPSHQGRGYATEAVMALVTAAWRREGVRAIIAETEPGNVASQRVLEKASFVLDDDSRVQGRRYRSVRPASLRRHRQANA
jgi:[ribosomal protein S5]-alanine N-acetyltransferase